MLKGCTIKFTYLQSGILVGLLYNLTLIPFKGNREYRDCISQQTTQSNADIIIYLDNINLFLEQHMFTYGALFILRKCMLVKEGLSLL